MGVSFIRTSHCLTSKRKKCKGGLRQVTLEAVYPRQTTSEWGQAGTMLKRGSKAEQTRPVIRAQCCQVQNCTEPSGL